MEEMETHTGDRLVRSDWIPVLDVKASPEAKGQLKKLPPNFRITVPKLQSPVHVSAVARACAAIEKRLGLRAGTLALELMIETPQSILAPDGSSILRALVVSLSPLR